MLNYKNYHSCPQVACSLPPRTCIEWLKAGLVPPNAPQANVLPPEPEMTEEPIVTQVIRAQLLEFQDTSFKYAHSASLSFQEQINSASRQTVESLLLNNLIQQVQSLFLISGLIDLIYLLNCILIVAEAIATEHGSKACSRFVFPHSCSRVAQYHKST
jgi:hypothetical protein